MAITTFSGDLSSVFPAGTVLEARPASNWPAHKRPPEAGTSPVGSATATATSASSGVLSLTGLADSTEYYVSDAAGTRYVRVTTFPERQELMSNQANAANGYAKLDGNAKVPWALVAGAEFHVKDAAYGAKLDGTDDTTAVQNAINDAAAAAAASSSGMATVVVDGGLATVTNLTPKNGVSYEGRNGGGFKATAGNLSPIFFRTNASTGVVENVTFRNLRFQGELSPATPSNQLAIYMRAAASGLNKNIRVLDCTFDDFKSCAVHILEAQQVQIRGNTIRNCATTAGGRNAVNVGVDTTSGAQDAALIGETIIANNIIEGPVTAAIDLVIVGTGFSARAVVTGNVCKAGAANGWAGIAAESAGSQHHVAITGNTLLDFQTGIDIANTGGTSPQPADYRGFVVTGNVIDDANAVTSGNGIRCQGSNAVIAANSYRGGGAGIFATGIDSTHRAQNQVIANNVLVGNAAAGAARLIWVQSSDNASVYGNRMSYESGATGRGLYMFDCAAPHVAGNHLNTPQRHGFELGDCVDAVFAGNVIYDPGTQTSNTYSGISVGGAVGTTVIRDNEIVDRRGGSAKMKYGIDASGVTSGTVRRRDNTLLGWLTAATTGTFTLSRGSIEQATTPATLVNEGVRDGYGSAAPVSGTWAVGDRVWNTAPAAAGTMGWVCTTAGTPGTWKTFGTIAA